MSLFRGICSPQSCFHLKEWNNKTLLPSFAYVTLLLWCIHLNRWKLQNKTCCPKRSHRPMPLTVSFDLFVCIFRKNYFQLGFWSNSQPGFKGKYKVIFNRNLFAEVIHNITKQNKKQKQKKLYILKCCIWGAVLHMSRISVTNYFYFVV